MVRVLSGVFAVLLIASSAVADDAAKTEEAKKCADEVAKLTMQVAERPDDAYLRYSLIHALQTAGMVYLGLDKRQEAESYFRSAIVLAQQLVAEQPNDPAARSTLASVLGGVGHLHKSLGRNAEAEKAFRESVAINEKLVADVPKDGPGRYGLASSYMLLGEFFAETGKATEAVALARKSVAIMEGLPAEFKKNENLYLLALMNTYSGLWLVLQKTGPKDEADAAIQKLDEIMAKFKKLQSAPDKSK